MQEYEKTYTISSKFIINKHFCFKYYIIMHFQSLLKVSLHLDMYRKYVGWMKVPITEKKKKRPNKLSLLQIKHKHTLTGM